MNSFYKLQEEELKLVIAEQFFAQYDCKPRIGKIDFCAVQKQNNAINNPSFHSLYNIQL